MQESTEKIIVRNSWKKTSLTKQKLRRWDSNTGVPTERLLSLPISHGDSKIAYFILISRILCS